ncbi:MAG: hypothetical protein V1924_02790 [Candidatus Bathyarchaeota archaeon]
MVEEACQQMEASIKKGDLRFYDSADIGGAGKKLQQISTLEQTILNPNI